jgi:hypothetical protein
VYENARISIGKITVSETFLSKFNSGPNPGTERTERIP